MILEDAVQKRLTHAFILTMPVEITLIPRSRVKQSTGGFVWTKSAPRSKQIMRLIEPGPPMAPLNVTDGVSRDLAYMLLGEWDAIIGLYDVFDHEGSTYEISGLYPFNGWERRAEVIRHG